MDIGDLLGGIADLVGPTLPWSTGGEAGAVDPKVPPAPTTRELGEDDHGRTLHLRKGDMLTIMLPAQPAPEVTTHLVKPDHQMLLVMEDAIHDRWHDVRCRALGTGDTRIEVEYLHDDGGIRSLWRVDLQVGE